MAQINMRKRPTETDVPRGSQKTTKKVKPQLRVVTTQGEQPRGDSGRLVFPDDGDVPELLDFSSFTGR